MTHLMHVLAGGNMMRDQVTRGLTLFAAALLLYASPAAHAQAPSGKADEAAELAAKAADMARQKRYAEAAELYEKAYGLDQAPVLLFNLALVHERLGNLFRAVNLYEKYITVESDPESVKKVVDKLVVLRPKAPGKLRVEGAPAGATVSVDGRVVGAFPLVSVELKSGDHDLVIESQGFGTIKKRVTIEGARERIEKVTLIAEVLMRPEPALPLQPPASEPRVGAQDDDGGVSAWVWVGIGAAVLAGAGVAGWFLLAPDSSGPPGADATWTLPGSGGLQ